MALADRLARENRPAKECAVAARVPATDREALDIMLESWTLSDIVQALRAEGVRVSTSAVGNHRRGVCICD